MDEELQNRLNVALNEAALLGVEVDPDRQLAGVTLRVLTLPASGPPPSDSRVQLRLQGVCRVLASFRRGRWDDPEAEVVPFELPELLGVVESFGGQPIYGWDFFRGSTDLTKRRAPLSLRWSRSQAEGPNSIVLFQESATGPDRFLEVAIWFDAMEIWTPEGSSIPLSEFADGGVRWWDGLYSGDDRTRGEGIVPGGPPNSA